MKNEKVVIIFVGLEKNLTYKTRVKKKTAPLETKIRLSKNSIILSLVLCVTFGC